jgi:hypothetical protein
MPADPARLFRFAHGQNPGAHGFADLANAFAFARTATDPQAGVVLMQAATALVDLASGVRRHRNKRGCEKQRQGRKAIGNSHVQNPAAKNQARTVMFKNFALLDQSGTLLHAFCCVMSRGLVVG